MAMQHQHESKTKLLDATLKVVRAKGYSATRIEDVCAEAGLTKGSFFHHFKNKEDLALAAVAHWDAYASQIFAAAPYRDAADALSRLIAYIEFRKSDSDGRAE
jgi:TetR/AcrR family transcriptional repressor of nem operon